MTEDWRVQVTGEDYLRGQQKRVATEQRRPVIRKASDLVGPGIGAAATVITDYNDPLATFNGYYSSTPGALYAPNPDDPFVGSVIMDSTLGGVQTFTSLTTGVEYNRTFIRNPGDEGSISFGLWHSLETIPASVYSLPTPPNSQVITVLTDEDAVVCSLPGLQMLGDRHTYAPSTRTLSVTRQGVYSGYFWWRTTENIIVDTLQIEFPNGDQMTYDVMYNVIAGSGLQVPLHFVATNALGFVRVTATQSTGSNAHAEFERLHLSRIGDAS